MTRICTISKAISITSATVANIDETAQKNIEIFGIVSDSRKLKTGELFVALTGENFDGHGFVAAAIAQGAVAAIVSHEWAKSEAAKGLPVLAVRNTLTAYQDLARWWRTQFQQPVISVTGSVGKTTTKEIIASMLACYVSPHKQVHKSQANHNNDIGVAQTLLAIDRKSVV